MPALCGAVDGRSPNTTGTCLAAIRLTPAPPSRRLIFVRRVLVLLVVQALIATSGVVSLLHIHSYGDHDHPEHHHGLAAHEHHGTRPHSPDDTVRLETCDPRRHTMSFAFMCVGPPQSHPIDAEFVQPSIPVPELPEHPAVGPRDIRGHGPPALDLTSPRAPPTIFPA